MAAARDVAMREQTTHDDAHAALGIYIHAINRLGMANPPNNEGYNQLAADTPKLIARYCRSSDIVAHPEPCGTLVQIQLDLRPRGSCNPSGPPMLPREIEAVYIRFAESELKIWNDLGKHLCVAKHPVCRRMADLLHDVSRVLQATNRATRAMDVRRTLLDPQYGMHITWAAQLAMFEGAEDLAQSLLDFDQAANWYEGFAREWPQNEKAPAALERAATLRLLLDDDPAAKRNAEIFERHFGQWRPEHLRNLVNLNDRSPRQSADTAARIALAIATHAILAGKWADAETWLEKRRARIERITDIDVHIVFHALLARIAKEKQHTDRAFAEYAEVRRAWSKAPAKTKKLGESHLNVEQFIAVLEAVGEAEFFFAERAGAAAEAIKMPPYRGPIAEKPLLQYVKTLAPWIKNKKGAIENADEAYLKVLQIEPIAPPRWAIASAARVGALWAAFADELTSVPKLTGPIPGRGGLTYEELGAAYAGSVSGPDFRGRAKNAYKTCIQTSIRYKFFDENSRQCEKWLAKHDPSSSPALDELHDTPSRVAFGLQTRPIGSEHGYVFIAP